MRTPVGRWTCVGGQTSQPPHAVAPVDWMRSHGSDALRRQYAHAVVDAPGEDRGAVLGEISGGTVKARMTTYPAEAIGESGFRRWRDLTSGDAVSHCRRRVEVGIGHAKWAKDVIPDVLLQRLATGALHHVAQQYIVEIAVAETVTGRSIR